MAHEAASADPNIQADARPLASWWALALAVCVGAIVETLVFLVSFQISLPPDDGAKGQGSRILVDPFVWTLGLPMCGIGALVAFLLSFLWNRRRDRWHCTEFICGVTWSATIVGTLVLNWGGVLVAFAALILASVFCAFSSWSWLARTAPR